MRVIKNENDDENENNESVIPSEGRDLASRLGKRLCETLLPLPCAAAHRQRTYLNWGLTPSLSQGEGATDITANNYKL